MVLEKVKMILSNQFDVEEDAITPETNIADDLGADSLDVVDMLMSLEDEFDVEIPDEEIERIRTVGALVTYIEENMYRIFPKDDNLRAAAHGRRRVFIRQTSGSAGEGAPSAFASSMERGESAIRRHKSATKKKIHSRRGPSTRAAGQAAQEKGFPASCMLVGIRPF